MAIRFAQNRITSEFNKEASLEIIIQRIADVKAEAALIAKGAGKGDQNMG